MDLETLVLKAQDNDKKSLEELIKHFKPYIVKQARCTYIKGHEIDDLIQIGYVSLLKAVKMYNPSNKNFNYYALASIKRNFYYLIRQEARYNGEYSMEFETGEGLTLGDSIEDKFDLETNYIKKETHENLKEALKLLDKEEKQLIKWIYMDKKSIKEYAEMKKITYNQGRYKLKLTIKKLRELLSNQ